MLRMPLYAVYGTAITNVTGAIKPQTAGQWEEH